MGRLLDFDAAITERRAQTQDDPLIFKLADEEFKASNPVPAMPMLEMSAKFTEASDLLNGDGAADEAKGKGFTDMLTAVQRFLTAIVEPVDEQRLTAALHRSRAGFDDLMEMVGRVMGEATGRPFPQSSSSEEPSSPAGPSQSPKPAPSPAGEVSST